MRIACVQTDVAFGDVPQNAAKAVEKLESLSADGVEFVVFPEAYLTGYCVDSAEDAARIAIEWDLASSSELPTALDKIREASDRLNMGCVVGFAGQTRGHFYNAAVLLEPGQAARTYVKTHLPYLGYDRFAKPGSELEIFETRWGKVGVLICFDLRPPEAARTLSLKGADIIVLPTNWPIGAEVSATHVSIARAAENKVFVATCNRVGTENGTTFIGKSRIIAPSGKVLQEAGNGEETLVAELDFEEARNKRIVNIPGEYEMEVFATRQPDLYRIIADDHDAVSSDQNF